MDDRTQNVLIILIIALAIVSISFFILKSDLEDMKQPKLEKAFDGCLSKCDSLSNTVGKQNLEEAKCIKECYDYYEDKKCVLLGKGDAE